MKLNEVAPSQLVVTARWRVYRNHVPCAPRLLLLLLLPACSRDFDPVGVDLGKVDASGWSGGAAVDANCVEATNGAATYRACAALENYADASAECTAWGGMLVVLDSAEEEQAVTNFAYANGAANYWIGGSDSAREGSWQWADGRVFWVEGSTQAGVYSHWYEGEPNNGASAGEADEDCAYMYRRSGWNDVDCTVERSFVCERR